MGLLAHSRGIIHRDIKPSNLLLDAAGTVWVAQLHQVIADGSVEWIAFSSDGSRLAASTVTTKSVQIWETESAQQLAKIRAHSQQIRGIAFTHQGEELLTVAGDGKLKSWNIAQARPFFQFSAQEVLGDASAVELGAEHTMLSRLRNAAKVRMMRDLPEEMEMRGRLGTHGATWHCAENLVYMAVYKQDSTNNVNLEIWEIDGAEPVLIQQKNFANPSSDDKLTDLAVSEDGSAVAWCVGGEVFALKVRTGDLIPVTSDNSEDTEPASHVILSPDGKSLVAWVGDYENVTWDLSGDQAVRLQTLEGVIRCARFSPDGNQLAQGHWPSQVRVMNPRTGEVIHEFVGHAGSSTYVTFSPDGTRLASGGVDGIVRLWNLDSKAPGEPVLAFRSPEHC